VIEGGAPLHGATVEAFHDHRIAMSMGIAQLVCAEKINIQGAEAASISFPTFWEEVKRLEASV
jgi:3-phosphoshikimate 1-carboxyvinyltransferase